MARLRTNGKKKLNKALFRVEKVVILDIRKNMKQQKKWKAKIVTRQQQKNELQLLTGGDKKVKKAA